MNQTPKNKKTTRLFVAILLAFIMSTGFAFAQEPESEAEQVTTPQESQPAIHIYARFESAIEKMESLTARLTTRIEKIDSKKQVQLDEVTTHITAAEEATQTAREDFTAFQDLFAHNPPLEHQLLQERSRAQAKEIITDLRTAKGSLVEAISLLRVALEDAEQE